MKMSHVLLCAVAALPLMTTTAAGESVERSFRVNDGGTLTVTADASTINISSHRGNEVEVSVSSSDLEDFEVSIRQRGDDVVVDVEIDRETRGFFGLLNSRRNGCNVEVLVPETYNARLKTSGGKITVEDLRGSVQCNTSGGGIKLGNIHGTVDAKTSGGPISIEGSSGDITLRTSGGGITMGDIGGDVDANTSGGGIKLDRANGDVRIHTSGGSIHVGEVAGSIEATTSGGSVTAYISEQPSGDCRLTSSGGGVTVHVNPDLQFSINAHSSGGKVEGRGIMIELGEKEKNTLVADMNGGGPELYLRSSGGGVRIEAR